MGENGRAGQCERVATLNRMVREGFLERQGIKEGAGAPAELHIPSLFSFFSTSLLGAMKLRNG